LLTQNQRPLLLRYRSFRDALPSAASLLMRLLPRVVIASGIVVVSSVVSKELALVMGGFLAGALLREAALTLKTVGVMPALFRVIDWGEVDRILEEDTTDGD
jgi:hypothetical protein